MKKLFYINFFILLVLTLLSCHPKLNKETEQFELDILQINDVYEIAPLENGKYGGMARVATLIKDMKAKNKNSFSVLSGDFLNPSVIGTLKYNGHRIKGRQMVECMNAAGIDYVTFGNHEFDLKYHQLQRRINESNFEWIASNPLHHTELGDIPFAKLVRDTFVSLSRYKILNYTTELGQNVKVGILASTIPSNKKQYVRYEDFEESITKDYETIIDSVDILIAITHLSIKQDKYLAKKLPEIDLILGGHEHINMLYNIGFTRITKADANAKSAYFHKLIMDVNTKELVIKSKLINIDESIKEDKECKAVEQKWLEIANKCFKEKGLDPNEVIGYANDPLDGREKNIRFRPTNLGALLAKSMVLAATKDSTIALLNSGAIRLDDQLSGPITQYDIIRTLPYGGTLIEMKIKGTLLQKVLETGLTNAGNGGFLIRKGISPNTKGEWIIMGEKLNPNKYYNLITSDYLVSGNEANLDYLTLKNNDIKDIIKPSKGKYPSLKKDIRQAVIHYLKNKN